MMLKIKRFVKQLISDPEYKLCQIALLFLKATWIPDGIYIKYKYHCVFGKPLNLRNPKTFNEKLQWLKLFDRNPLYTILVDKSFVKDWVAKKIGQQYITKTYGVYQNVNDINFSELPSKFVLKCTHDSGSVMICKDKNSFDFIRAKDILQKGLETNFYLLAREWPYKKVPPKIIAEEYLEPSSGDLNDYKFFCFGGKVEYFKIDFDRFYNHGANYYDRFGTLTSLGEEVCPPNPEKKLMFPSKLNKMIELAEILAEGIAFVRVDFYDVDGSIYFGELTFSPNAGFGKFIADGWDEKLGKLLILPSKMT